MRGADALRQMRREGYAPNLVIIDLEENWLRSWAEWERLNPTIAKLAPKPGEVASRADLRCVVGLSVFVTGDDPAAVHAWRDACIAADAKRVIAAVTRCVNPDAPAEFHRFDTDELTDTSGALDSDAASAKIAQRRECTVVRHG